MDSDIKIFFDDRVVILSKNIKKSSIDNGHVYVFEDKKALAQRLNRFGKSSDECLYVTHSDRDELFGYVKQCFIYLEAAGGLVTLPDGRILFIKRLGKWDLPKGKAEKGESMQETAIREVMEECGLETSPKITAVLAHTYHTYHRDGDHVLKHTAWYAMRYDGDDDAIHPQYDEDITDVVWLPENQMDIVLKNTYGSIGQVLNEWLVFNG